MTARTSHQPRQARADWPWLVARLDAARDLNGWTDRDVADHTGVPASTLTRLRQGRGLSADSLARLLVWLIPAAVPPWVRFEPAPEVAPTHQQPDLFTGGPS